MKRHVRRTGAKEVMELVVPAEVVVGKELGKAWSIMERGRPRPQWTGPHLL